MEHKVTKKAMASLKVAHSQLKIDHDDIQVVLKKREKELMKCYSGKSTLRDGRLGQKVGQIGPKLDKYGTFSDQILVHFESMKKSRICLICGQYAPLWAEILHPCRTLRVQQ